MKTRITQFVSVLLSASLIICSPGIEGISAFAQTLPNPSSAPQFTGAPQVSVTPDNVVSGVSTDYLLKRCLNTGDISLPSALVSGFGSRLALPAAKSVTARPILPGPQSLAGDRERGNLQSGQSDTAEEAATGGIAGAESSPLSSGARAKVFSLSRRTSSASRGKPSHLKRHVVSPVLRAVKSVLDRLPNITRISPASARSAGQDVMDTVLGAVSVKGQSGPGGSWGRAVLQSEVPKAGGWGLRLSAQGTSSNNRRQARWTAWKSGALNANSDSKKTAGDDSVSKPPSDVPSVAKSDQPEEPGRKGFWGWLAHKFIKSTRIFKDEAKNKTFWRFFLGYEFAMAGFKMFEVALPYLVSSFTWNTMFSSKAPGAGAQEMVSSEVLKTVVRQRRSVINRGRLGAQLISFLTMPFLVHKHRGGSKAVLVRSGFVRAAILLLIPGFFFFYSGAMPAAVSFGALLGLLSVHSYFEGVHSGVTLDGGVTVAVQSRVMGSVTPDERSKGNVVLGSFAAAISILAPAIAGKLSRVKHILGKTGSGSAVAFLVYAGVMVVSTISYMTMSFRSAKNAKKEEDLSSGAGSKSMRVRIKSFSSAMFGGFGLVFKDRFFRGLAIIDGVAMFLLIPLMFTILPEYISGIVSANPASMQWLMGIPVLGWLVDGLVNTPMGVYGMVLACGSLGSLIGNLLVGLARRLFGKLGYRSEESLTIPFYGVAALEAVCFIGLCLFPSVWPILGLWFARSFFGAFASLNRQGLYQKHADRYGEKTSQIVAALMILTIALGFSGSAIYGWAMPTLSISVSMHIAGAASLFLAALRMISPWVMFTKEQRSRSKGEDSSN